MGGRRGDLEGLLTELLRSTPPERLGRLKSLGDPDEILAGLAQEAERWVIGDLRRSLEATDCLLELADTLGGASGRSRARRARAQALAYANRFDDALAVLNESVQLAASVPDETAAASARLAMVHPLARLGRYEEAVAAGQMALEGFQRQGELEWAAKAEVNLGVTHRMLNDAARALAHFDRARPVLASDPVNLAQLESNRADALLELNRFSEAEEAFTAALAAFEQAGLTRAAAIVEGNLADLMSRQGRLESALFHFEQARRHFESDCAAGDLARLEAEQAEALAGAGLLEEATETYVAALPQLDRHGLASEAARARCGLGKALMTLGRYDEAESALAAAADGFDTLKNTAARARVSLAQGAVAMARGRDSRAASLLANALEHLRDRPAEAAVARHHLAALALDKGDLPRAEGLLEEAIEAARQYNLAPLLADLLHARARLRTAQGRPQSARADLRGAVNEIERIRGSLQADRLRSAFVENRGAVYEDLVEALLESEEPDSAAEAFGTVERAKGRALLDLVAGAVGSASLIPRASPDGARTPLVDRVLRLRGDLNALYSRLGDPGPTALSGPSLRRWKQQVEECERNLRMLESRLVATHGLGGLFAAPADAAATQQLLDPSSALIEYFLMNDELIAFVVRPSSVRVFRRLAVRSELEDQVELAQFQIDRAASYTRDEVVSSDRLLADAQRELAGLHRLLIAPCAESLTGVRRLIIVPHGPLHAVPFHALYDGGRYLIEDYEVTYSPSASLLQHLHPRSAAGAAGAGESLIYGVADSAAPRIEQEVRAVAATLPNPRVYLGAEATWERLQREGRTAGVVHLACHAHFSPRSPLASGLKLGDRWMTVRDLYGLKLDDAVVVLSGCNTGRAVIAGGVDLVGLVQGFFAAGASALLMTLWALRDDIAENLVASIYRMWQNEEAPSLAAAVRLGQREMMKTFAHPVFWAPFVLVGRP